jgi:sugar lactone lactonase YvrE
VQSHIVNLKKLGRMKILLLKNAVLPFFLSMAVGTMLVSCQKGKTPGRPPLRSQIPVIDSISPKSGPSGTHVTIFGKYLGDMTSKVSLNGRSAEIRSASNSTLEISIPDSAGTGRIIVQTNNGEVTGPEFTYVFTNTWVVNTIAGSGVAGFVNGQGIAARFNSPIGIALDASGNFYVADAGNHCIRKISATEAVTTFAGTGVAGSNNGPGTTAQFSFPAGIAIDGQGSLFVADHDNHRIRRITSGGQVTTFAGSSSGFDNGQGMSANFNFPRGITIDGSGNFYVADGGNNSIRKITSTALVSTLAGKDVGLAEGVGAAARFNVPRGVAIMPSGNLYVADAFNHRIRRVTPASVVSTLTGSTPGFEDGTLTSAKFNEPSGITIDASGNIYVADSKNNRIRKITSSGEVTTLAGVGIAGDIDGVATVARFNSPTGIAVDVAGNVYVADALNHKIRKISLKRH